MSNNLQFRTIFFPAVLTSSVVFSALTLPLVLSEPQPFSSPLRESAVDPAPAPLSQVFQPIFEMFASGNKGLAIRYIGFSIVASVGAGIATAECVRKASRHLESDHRQLALMPNDSPIQPVLEFPSASWTEDTEAELAPVDFALEPQRTASPPFAFVEAASSTQYSMSESEANTVISHVQIDTSVDAPGGVSLVEDRSIASESGLVSILDNPTTYETCRIRVPHLQKHLFAILYQGEYYRLVRTRKNREKALDFAARLKQLGNDVLITQHDTAYTVWVLEAQAFPCTAYL